MTTDADLPEHVEEATPEWMHEYASPKMLRLRYEEKYLRIEFPERTCPECGEQVRLRIERDTYRETRNVECPECGVIEA